MAIMAQTSWDPAPVEPSRSGTANRRAGVITVDQAISSASNLLVLIWVAHTLSPADFGRFSLVFFVYMFTQGAIVRSLVSATVLVHPEDADHNARRVLGAAILLSFVAGALCILIGAAIWSTGSELAPSIFVMGITLPLLGVQDVGRYIAVAESKPGRAVVLDSLWLVLLVVAFVLVEVGNQSSLLWLVAAWSGSGAVSGLWVFVQQGIPRARELSFDWLRLRWSFSWRSMVASTSSSTVALIGSSLMAVVSGPVAVAAVRAALLLERPSTTVQGALAASASTDVAREQPDNAALMRHQRRIMRLSILTAVLNFAVLLVLPDKFGELLLGQVWDVVKPLVLVVGLHVTAIAAQSGVRAALMGRRQIQSVMVVDIAGTVLSIVGLMIGASIADAEGAMWGAVVGQAITAAIWWLVLARHLAQHEQAHEAESFSGGVVPQGQVVGEAATE
jgi:O-antigen/teichoic acid export membrane protein